MTKQSTQTVARLVGGLSLGALVALTGCKSSGETAPEDGAGDEPATSQPAEGAESSCGGEGGCGGDGSCGGDGK